MNENYVPVPQPAKSNYTVCAHYYPGWCRREMRKRDLKVRGFEDILDFPERTPLCGYYDESNPEFFDWQIKWAVEHGINCFIHCWYRTQENVGKPVTVKDLQIPHAIHEAYFNARYRNMMQFAIMWECDVGGKAADAKDLTENLLPFWVENYFSDPNYLTIDGKPVLFIYAFKQLADHFGGVLQTQKVLEALHEAIKAYGFSGIHISGLYSYPDMYASNQWQYSMDEYKQMGVNSSFQYCWQILTNQLTPEEMAQYRENYLLDSKRVLSFIREQIAARIAYDPYYTMYTATCMRDSEPWFEILNIDPEGPMVQFRLSPEEWKEQLIFLKQSIDALPEDSIGRKFVVLDNWNEWAEGHFIAPSAGYGFGYLDAVREVLTACDNQPEHRMPEAFGLGPYGEADAGYPEKQSR